MFPKMSAASQFLPTARPVNSLTLPPLHSHTIAYYHNNNTKLANIAYRCENCKWQLWKPPMGAHYSAMKNKLKLHKNDFLCRTHFGNNASLIVFMYY